MHAGRINRGGAAARRRGWSLGVSGWRCCVGGERLGSRRGRAVRPGWCR